MKLRLTQPGFENYTGQMGVIFFEDGLSTGDVLERDAVRMAAVMFCEREDGTSPSVTQSLLDNTDTPAPMFKDGDEQHDEDAAKQPVKPEAEAAPARTHYTREQLEAIADDDGIRGLRAIAEPLGIKAGSIKELIAAILKAE